MTRRCKERKDSICRAVVWHTLMNVNRLLYRNCIGKVVETGTSSIESLTGKSRKNPAMQERQQDDILWFPGVKQDFGEHLCSSMSRMLTFTELV